MGGVPGRGLGGREWGGAPGRRLGCGGCVGAGMEAWEAGHRRRGWDGGAAGGVGRKGAIGVRLLPQDPPAAPPVWSLRAPSAAPSLPASPSSARCSSPCSALATRSWELRYLLPPPLPNGRRLPGLPPRTGGHLSRAFPPPSDCTFPGGRGLRPIRLGAGRAGGCGCGQASRSGAAGSGLCRCGRVCLVPRLRGRELREAGGVSPLGLELPGPGRSPPLAWELPGLGCASALGLGAPWMGIWASSLPCRPGPCRADPSDQGLPERGAGCPPAAAAQTAVSAIRADFLEGGLFIPCRTG